MKKLLLTGIAALSGPVRGLSHRALTPFDA